MRCNDSTSSPKSSFLKLMKVFIGSWNTPVVSISLSVFPSRCAVLFSPLRYHLGASANFANLQGLHLLLNRCWWQVSPRILIGSCIMSKNDGAGLEAAKVTQSHPFTQTNGINESSLSGTPPPPSPNPSTRLPLSSSVSHAFSSSLSSLFSLTRCISLSPSVFMRSRNGAAPRSRQAYCHIYWLSQKCPRPFLPA